MESRTFFGVVGQHVVCEKLPVRVQSFGVLHSALVDLVQLPFFLEVVVGLDKSRDTLTF